MRAPGYRIWHFQNVRTTNPELRRLRAALHQAGARRAAVARDLERLQSELTYFNMLNPPQSLRLQPVRV